MSKSSQYQKKHAWALKAFVSLELLRRLFLMFHWSNSKYLGLFGAGILLLFYPYRYYKKENKQLLDHVKLLFALVYCVTTLAQLQYLLPVKIALALLFAYWFINEGFYYWKLDLTPPEVRRQELEILDREIEEAPTRTYKSFLVDWAILLSGVLTIVGAMFKINHWPFASEMLIIGFSLIVVLIWGKDFNSSK